MFSKVLEELHEYIFFFFSFESLKGLNALVKVYALKVAETSLKETDKDMMMTAAEVSAEKQLRFCLVQV